MAGVTFTRKINRSVEDLVQRIKGGAFELFVGIAAQDANKRAASDGPTNVQLAQWHEFGVPGRLPKRSFLRATMTEHRSEYRKIAAAEWKKYIAVKQSAEEALMRLGLVIVADIRRAILKGIPPPLQPETLARKRKRGYARPRVALYATGALYNAISAHVVRKGGKR